MDSGGAFGMPSFSRPKIPSMGMPRMPSMGMPRMPSAPKAPKKTSKSASTKPTIVQIILLVLFSFFLGTLMFYLHNKESDTTAIKNGIMVVCIMIAAIGITGFLHLNINIYDLLLASEINILCLFLFLSYIGVTTFGSWGSFVDIGTYVKDLFSVFKEPTKLYSKGYDIIVPTLFMLIPFMVLITNFIKMSGVNFIGAVAGAVLTTAISVAVVYFIWPDNLSKPPIDKASSSSSGSLMSNIRNLW
jgi:heme/copper-type cytochrome/quinol oxidase subunit 4